MIENRGIDFNNLTDKQKLLSAKLSYLEIDQKKFEQLKRENGGRVTVDQLEACLKNPNELYLGEFGTLGKTIKMQTLGGISTENISNVSQTNKQLLEELVQEGFGEAEVLGIENDSKTGFQGICLNDKNNTKLFSVRGTDVKSLASFVRDGFTDAISYFREGKNGQNALLEEMVEKYGDSNGNNVLAGHSLGGQLVEKFLANHPDQAKKVVSINPFHIDSKEFENNPEGLDAFNSEKYECYISGGDPVSRINDNSLFADRVTYVRNTEEAADKNIITKYLHSHLTESFAIDGNGNFEKTTKEKAYEKYPVDGVDKLFEELSKLKESKLLDTIKDGFNNFIQKIKEVPTSLAKGIGSNIMGLLKKKDEPKLLKSAEQTQKLTPKQQMDAQKKSFEDSLLLENWVDNVTYTREDLVKAKEVFKNPTKGLNTNRQDDKTVSKDDWVM